MSGESRSRVHKHADKHRSDGKGDDIHAENAVFHEERNQQRIDRDHDVEHHRAAPFIEIMWTEQHHIAGKEQEQSQHKDGLTQDGEFHFAFRHIAPGQFLL